MLHSSSSLAPTPDEVLLADRILLKTNASCLKPEQLATAHLDADSAVDIFLGAQLSPEVLSVVWSESDIGGKGYLDRSEVATALRLIGWAQSGEHIPNRNLLSKVGPTAVLAGFPPVVPQKAKTKPPLPVKPRRLSAVSSSSRNSLKVEDLAHFKKLPLSPLIPDASQSSPTTSFLSPNTSVAQEDMEGWNVPPLFISHANKLFDRFDQAQKGHLDLNEALPLFHKANLTDDQLSRIWDVTGVTNSGHLSKNNFVASLFIVYRSLAGMEIPDRLPGSFATMFSIPQSDPFLNSDHEVSSFSPNEEDEVGSLYAQIRALQDAMMTIGRENEDLRSSVQTWTRLSRQQTISHNRMSRNVDTGMAELTRLQAELQEKDYALSRLRASAGVTENLSRESAMFRSEIEELTSRLQISEGEAAAQKLLADELARECERLGQELNRLRETSTRVPSVTGDEELQTLINEDLSRENGRLRNEVRELHDSLAQLQAPNDELNTLKETTRALTRENQRLLRQVRHLESSPTASNSTPREGQRRRVQEMNRENERLRRELEQARRRPSHQNTIDNDSVPPPAYEDINR